MLTIREHAIWKDHIYIASHVLNDIFIELFNNQGIYDHTVFTPFYFVFTQRQQLALTLVKYRSVVINCMT